MIGEILGPYEIQALLGEGGMGAVYRALDRRLGRTVALKLISDRIAGMPQARKRLVREARSQAAVHHPGIATLFGLESIDGHDILVMEYVEGRPLSVLLREGPVEVSRAREILIQICEALGHAHDHGLVHRDIKPDNVLVTPSGQVKILDFGLALSTQDTRITADHSTLGTLAYMSPEQARGESVDARSDLFSVGVIAWELLAGTRLFESENASGLLHRIARLERAPAAPDLPKGEVWPARFLDRALQPVAALRAASAQELLAILGRGATVRPEPSRRRGFWRILAPVLAGAVIAVAALWFSQRSGGPQAPAVAPDERIAVLPLRNLTHDAELDWFAIATSELLATTMARSGQVNVISPERVRLILDAPGPDPIGRLARARIGYAITGSMIQVDRTIRVETRMVDTANGTLLHSAEGEAADESGLYAVVAELDRSYREFIEARAISERIEEQWIQSLTTYSIEAYRAYARGREHFNASQWAPAIDFFSEAVAIDSTFVSAWVDLSACYWNTGESEAMAAAFDRAMSLRDRARPREQLWLDLYGAVTDGDGPRIMQYAGEFLEQEPEHRFARYLLGKGHYESGRWGQAVETWRPLREARWPWIWTYLYSSRALAELERFDDARDALDELDGVAAPDDDFARARLHRYRGLLAIDAGDGATALAELDRAAARDYDYPELTFDRARAWLLEDDPVRAREALERYLADPGEGVFLEESKALLAELD